VHLDGQGGARRPTNVGHFGTKVRLKIQRRWLPEDDFVPSAVEEGVRAVGEPDTVRDTRGVVIVEVRERTIE
jgi:hypothetical protein